jgi:uncharacterized protein YbjT (DUF2867 family)
VEVLIMGGDGPVLVIGATGNQGGQAVQALLAAGRSVHAFTRHPESPQAQQLKDHGARLVHGDLADLRGLRDAVGEVAGVFSVQNFWDLGLNEEVRLGSNVIAAAAQAGNRPHLVYSSGLGAERRQNVAAIDGKAVIEEQLRRSGLPFTILQPGLFMDDFQGASLPFAGPIQRMLRRRRPLVGRLFLATLRAAMPQRPIPLASLQDIGRMAAWIIQNPQESQSRTYRVVGSIDTADVLCRLWEEIRQESIPHIPALGAGVRLVHPEMAALLAWLGRHEVASGGAPIALQTYRTWLVSSGSKHR